MKNFDVVNLNPNALSRFLSFYQYHCSPSEMWGSETYDLIIEQLKQRQDSSSEFIKHWVIDLRSRRAFTD